MGQNSQSSFPFLSAVLNRRGRIPRVAGLLNATSPRFPAANQLNALVHKYCQAILCLDSFEHIARGCWSEFDQFGNLVAGSPRELSYWSPASQVLIGSYCSVLSILGALQDSVPMALCSTLSERSPGKPFSMPPSMARLVANREKLCLRREAKEAIMRYWNVIGSRVKDYRDQAAHKPLEVASIFVYPGEREVRVIAPDEPQVQGSSAVSFSNRVCARALFNEFMREFAVLINKLAEIAGGQPATFPQLMTSGVLVEAVEQPETRAVWVYSLAPKVATYATVMPVSNGEYSVDLRMMDVDRRVPADAETWAKFTSKAGRQAKGTPVIHATPPIRVHPTISRE